LTNGDPFGDISKAVDSVLEETDKLVKDTIRNNFGVALAAADLVSEIGRLYLRWWLGEVKNEKEDSK
jgi:hypothetical protein